MDPDLNFRLAALETHLTHLEHQYDQLNEVLIAQSREITRLKGVQQKIVETLEAAEGERIRATESKPPHYQ